MDSLVNVIEEESCPQVWLRTAKSLLIEQPQFSLVQAIRRPETLDARDFAICDEVDSFLVAHDRSPLNTVASTIFPAGFYIQGGAEAVFREFPVNYEKVKEGWGTYAYRMVKKSAASKTGNPDEFIIPLEILVEKLRAQLKHSRFKAIYEVNFIEADDLMELPVYDGALDSGRTRRHPCLSHISLKLLPENRIMMTALYRYHYYIEKALGNLLGLAQLLTFIARETGLEVGPLICHSTYAVLDREKWSLDDVSNLISRCDKISEERPKLRESLKTQAKQSQSRV